MSRPPFSVPVASRRSNIASFIAMDVMREAKTLARAGAEIVHCEVGEPGAAPPRPVREAAIAALSGGRVSYTEALGIPALREAIARNYATKYGVNVDPARVIVTTGSSGGFVLGFLAMLDHGGRIGIPNPGYPAYRNILDALGIESVPIETGPQSRYALSAAAIRAAHAEKPLDAVLLMSPANPTGVLTPAAEVKAIAKACAELGIWLVSDEIYHGLTHEGEEATALASSDDAVIVNSFSKYYCMTGWRVGWLVVPERLIRPIECLQQNLSISVPYLSQIAAVAAFQATEELESIKAGYAKNRAILMEALPRLGLPPLPMDGAFYAYCDIAQYSNDSMDFARRALREAGLAITPGLDFDPVGGNRFVRFSYAGSEKDIVTAVKRLEGWLGK
ncbi:MAG: aminotransferase class I/II-fold pyridoxal phosphate-dependent enzyme [Methylobacterium sp.]|nr:aminotransferase class I/II-fold pyridoxal phosphate-dependent enzyme [Methylobacterium sp.]MCA3607762.1 aminotransferase class I/II-fold pyridoxal phosphate-dependent enzyme [Methylobacterium sp.]MCA3609826.1 aminotransferase class I/II-fold pyridoxal phosphate-dependent enzyme [Methylobacterium sp.]MCA3617059.1 aminotransferase class I/II-fold pyridoxal phosphate-dependent enzyme [Methylobacterium sp.]MCA3621327.1 aminotransferase class I/II-fold pyridoxal phosphate-dependent enzyme [Methy